MRTIALNWLIISILVLSSCNRSAQNEQLSDFEKEKIVDEFREMNKRANEIYYRFPAPDEMFNYVNDEGLEFDNTLLNPTTNLSGYIDSKTQTINLGIYMADLGYITLFEKYKESVNYFNTIIELSEKLRVSTAFDKSLIGRIENNLKNVDSLKDISNDSYSYLIDYLVQNDKEKTFAVISMGGYIEFLYLTLHLVDKYDAKSATIQRIAEQKYVFENLYFYFEEFKGDPIVDALSEDVDKIKAIIDQIGEEKAKTEVTKSEDGKLILGGGTKIFINSEQFYALKDVSSEIRNKFVGQATN